MARRLTLAEREDRGAKAYDLSLQGCSYRSIGKQLGISDHTAASLIQKEAQKRAEERPDRRQFALDSLRRAMQRAWQELDRNPSPHATAQLLHALNALQSEMNKIDGIHAPSRVDARVDARVLDARVALYQEHYFKNLGAGPLEAVSAILNAGAAGEDGEDALAEIVNKHQEGTLAPPIYVSSADVLELVPEQDLPGVANLDELLNEDSGQ